MSFLGGSPAMIQLEGLTLNQGDPETSGLLIGFSTIDGWHKRAPMSVPRAQRTGHGEFASRGTMSGRVITINGWCVADARAAVGDWLESLAATLGDGGFGELTVIDEDMGVKSATVQMLDDSEADWDGKDWARFQIMLLSPDPFRYGPEQSDSTSFAMPLAGSGLRFPMFGSPSGRIDFGAAPTAASVLLDNPGNATAWPTFTVAGPANGFRVMDVAASAPLDFEGFVPAGSTVRIDTSTGRALLDGEDQTIRVSTSSWPSIPPFSQRTYFFEPLGGASAAVLTASVRPTYW